MKYIKKRAICILFLIACIAVYYVYVPNNTVRTRSEEELRCNNIDTSWDSLNEWEQREIPITKNTISPKTKNEYYALKNPMVDEFFKNRPKYGNYTDAHGNLIQDQWGQAEMTLDKAIDALHKQAEVP